VDIQLFDSQWELSQIFAKTRTTFLDIIPTFDRLVFSWMPCSNYEGEGAKPPKTLRFHIANYLEESVTQVGLTARIKEYTAVCVIRQALKKLCFKKRTSWQLMHGFPHTRSSF